MYYTPLAANGLLNLVPLSNPEDGVYAHPPTILEGEFNPIWTNPSLYGFLNLLSPSASEKYTRHMEGMKVPALLLDNHYEWTASGRPGVRPNCEIDYAECDINGTFQDYLARLTSSHRRSVLKDMERSTVLKVYGSVYDCSLHHDFELKALTLTDFQTNRRHDNRNINMLATVENEHHARRPGRTQEDLSRGMFETMVNYLINRQRATDNSYQREAIRNCHILVVVHKPSGTHVSFHLVGINYAAQEPNSSTIILHSFARMSMLSARQATTALIKAITSNRIRPHSTTRRLDLRNTFVDDLRFVTHLDITNVGLSGREEYKSDYMTGTMKAKVWASTALLSQNYPFITPL